MKSIVLAIAAALSAGAACAEDLGTATPQALQEAAILAVSDGDESRLMEVMQEMKRREMLFFRIPASIKGPECEREPDVIGVLLAHPSRRGSARQAYFTHMRELALGSGYCGCTTGQMTYADFIKEKFGVTPETMTEQQFLNMRAYDQEHGATVQQNYQKFFLANCRGE